MKTRHKIVNENFNSELMQQIAGTLPKGHIYYLGMPCRILVDCGFPELPIELSSTRLEEKSKQRNHQFDIIDVKNIVNALQDPVAVFRYGDKEKSQNVILDIRRDGKNFVVGIFFNQTYRGMSVSDIRGIFNKNNAEWLNWIAQGKTLYMNKNKIQTLINEQRTNLAEVAYLDLNFIESVLKTFVNPGIDKLRNDSADVTESDSNANI